MTNIASGTRIIVNLIDNRVDADAVADAVNDLTAFGPAAGTPFITVLTPPTNLLGRGFWSPGAQTWWTEHALDDADVALLISDTPGLARALKDVSAQWLVWCHHNDIASSYAGIELVETVEADNANAFVRGVVGHLTIAGWEFMPRPQWGPFGARGATAATPDPSRAADVEAVHGIDPSAPIPTHPDMDRADAIPPLPVLEWEYVGSRVTYPATTAATVPTTADAPADTSSDGALAPTTAPDIAAPSCVPLARPRLIERIASRLTGNGKLEPVDVGAIAHALVRAHSTIITVGSRKGGVGKTTESLALGFLASQAVEALGGNTLVVDANLTNADITSKLRLPAGSPTVRDSVAAVTARTPLPTPVSVAGTTLKVLGESRENERYERIEIERLATELRTWYTTTVVDLPNAVPGLEDKSESVVDAWLPHANVVVIPIDTSVASIEGAADMLDAINSLRAARSTPTKPGVVVAFMRPTDIDARRQAPALDEVLTMLDDLGARVVDIPASSRMSMIDWSEQRVPLVEADPKVTRAYWQLLAAVVAAREESHD